VSPESADIQRRLAAYLGRQLPAFRVLASGWETTVYEFIAPSAHRDLPTKRRLVLRFYHGCRAGAKAVRESSILRLLADVNYPVPRLYVFESDHGPLGAPFLIMECVAGVPLFSIRSFPQAFKTFLLGFISFVRAQAQLHLLGAAGQVALDGVAPAYNGDHDSSGALSSPLRCNPKLPSSLKERGEDRQSSTATGTLPLLERIFRTIAHRIERGPLPGLRDALLNLRSRAARFSPAPDTLVHMDYHPQNVMVSGFHVTGVLDWVNADSGDRYLCAATTATILSTTAMARPRWLGENAAGNTLRGLFASLYLPLYQALAPMELERFRFAQGVAALLRLSMFGMMRKQGAASVGFRPEAIENLSPLVVRLLCRYASRKSGVPASI